jgi:cold-inducible RNA-binding protein
MKISIGNIEQSVTEEELHKLFSAIGEVITIHIKRDKKTSTSLGYGSVEMSDELGQKAISELNGKELKGKALALVDSNELKKENSDHDKLKDKNAGNSKIHGSKASGTGFSGGMNRRSGGGGRGK